MKPLSAALGERNANEARATAVTMLRFVRKHVSSRKGVVVAMAFGLKEALDQLSPDERSQLRALIVEELL